MKSEIYILDQYGKKVSLKEGDIFSGYTGLKEDVYKENDSQVLSGKRKVGEAKIRYLLILKIKNPYDIDVIFASNSNGKKWTAQNKIEDKKYLFRGSTIRYINPQMRKKYFTKVF